jgi:hypothetical protein
MPENRKRARQKAKDKIMPPDVKDREWKLANPEYPSYDDDRELSETEKIHLFAMYQRYDHDTAKVAKSLGLSEDTAHRVIMEYLRDNPDLLNDPAHSLRLAYAADQVVAHGIVKVIENIEAGKLYGRGLMDTIKIAKFLKTDFLKDYKKGTADEVGSDEAAIDEAIKKLEDKIAADKRDRAETPVSEAATAAGGTGTEKTMGADA